MTEDLQNLILDQIYIWSKYFDTKQDLWRAGYLKLYRFIF